MESYLSKTGNLIYHYNQGLDDYEEAEKHALIKHNMLNKKITTIAVTRRTDFINKHVNVKRRKGLTVNSFGLTPPQV